MQGGIIWAAEAGENLSTSLFLFAAVDTDGTLIVADSSTAIVGVFVEGAVEGKPASVQMDGVGKVMLATTLNAGVRVQSDGNGKAVAWTSLDSPGIILQGGNSGDVVPILLGM